MTLATTGPNLGLVERFEQFGGKYGLSPLTTRQQTHDGNYVEQRLTPVTAYLKSGQILLFTFVRQ